MEQMSVTDTTIDASVGTSKWKSVTAALRWNNGVLEQCWAVSDGTFEWIAVPEKAPEVSPEGS